MSKDVTAVEGLPPVIDDDVQTDAPLIIHVDLEDGKPPIGVNIDALTFDDFVLLEKLESEETRKGASMGAIVECFNRCIVGGVGKMNPRRDMGRIGVAIGRAMTEASSPNS